MFFVMEEVVEKCVGCQEINASTNRCACYCSPAAKWEHTPKGVCPRASHIVKETKEKKMVNSIKASKRAAQGQSAE
jgi:hypothetical protein